MLEKNNVKVIINGKVYTLSGVESETYLHKVASYLDNKLAELRKTDSYRNLNAEYQNVLLSINLADDYFKQCDHVAALEEELNAKDTQAYEMKHDLVELQIRIETLQQLSEDYKNKMNELQSRILTLEAERENYEETT